MDDRLEEAKQRRARFVRLRKQNGLTRESCEDDLGLYAWLIGEIVLLRARIAKLEGERDWLCEMVRVLRRDIADLTDGWNEVDDTPQEPGEGDE